MVSSDPADERDVARGPSDDPALLAAAFTALPELVFVLDRDGRYVDVLGGRDDTRYHDGTMLVGRTLYDVLPQERADEFLARIRQALDTGEVVYHEYRLSVGDVDGIESRPGVPDHLWFEGRVAPVAPSAGRDDLVVWLAFNVTEARLAARQLQRQKRHLEQQRAELETLSRDKQRLVSVVSHDLRSPLTAIQGFLEVLDARWDELDREQARELLQRGAARAAQMEQMLVDLLAASRREHVEMAAAARDLQAEDVLRDVVDEVDAVRHGIEVGQVEGRVHADPVHLERILINLLDNARKYGAPPVEVSSRQDGRFVHIRVRDHGDGIAPEFVPELFTAFTQASPATPAAEGGIGLGLSIVHQLAQINGGTVTHELTDDGACFVVTLPAAPGPAPKG